MTDDRRTSSPLPLDLTTGSEPFARSWFVPRRYEPNYPYPLLVLLHGRGGDDRQMVRAMPALSWRNYVAVSIRGSEPTPRREGLIGYSWGAPFARPDRAAIAQNQAATVSGDSSSHVPPVSVAVKLQKLLHGPVDPITALEDAVFDAVRQTRRALHVHSERIYLVGCGEGAAVAYRLGLSFPERFAGVVAINGWLPSDFRPLGRVKECRDLRLLVVHGEWNGRAPIEAARRDVATFRTAGMKVAFHSYPCSHRLAPPMLNDVDSWLIRQCTAE